MSELDERAQSIARRQGMSLGERLYQGTYYAGQPRAVIYAGEYNGYPAALKVYDDPRPTDEPVALQAFLERNRSQRLVALQLYAFEVLTSRSGWFIMERLPTEAKSFTSPLDPTRRQEFLGLYREYRRNWPTEPTRPLSLPEQLLANEFNLFRVNRWFELASLREEERRLAGQEVLLDPATLLPRLRWVRQLINSEFARRRMEWSHGHFKPKELFHTPGSSRYYLTDFAHAKMYPEGYEFGIMVWADWLMTADWRLPYTAWRAGIDAWQNDLQPVAVELGIQGYRALMNASLAERTIGSILADVTAANRPPGEAQQRLALLTQLLDELIATTE